MPRRSQKRGPSVLFVAAVAIAVTVVGMGAIALLEAVGSRGSGGEVGGPATTEGPGAHPATTSDGPDLHFATTAVDFGVVPLGKEVGYAFSYANVGNEEVRINDVKVSVEEGC